MTLTDLDFCESCGHLAATHDSASCLYAGCDCEGLILDIDCGCG